jgi:group I intron endonuclease
MSQVYLVYMHTAPNGKAYIGQTFDYQRRCCEHQKQNGCIAFARAILKYGWNNFKHEILKDNLTIDEANLWEQFYIKKFNTVKPNGYNLRDGGKNSRLHESSKKKIGDANRGRIQTKEHKEKNAKANTGKKHTIAHKDYMRNKMKDRKFSPETIEKMRLSAKKRSQDPNWRLKISKTFIQKGHVKTNTHLAAISKAAKERWKKFRENKNV